MLFTLKKVIGNMLLPLPLMLLIIGAGLALLWFSRFQKTGKIFISIGWLALLLLSLQPVADRLLRTDFFTNVEHRCFVDFTFTNDDGAVNVDLVEHNTHGVYRRAVRGVFIAAS